MKAMFDKILQTLIIYFWCSEYLPAEMDHSPKGMQHCNWSEVWYECQGSVSSNKIASAHLIGPRSSLTAWAAAGRLSETSQHAAVHVTDF